jgi:hypothetical protein
MGADQVAVVTASAALLTGLATLFSIRELRLQRKVQHRPELILEDVGFRALRLRGESRFPVVTLAHLGSPPQRGDTWRGDLPIRIQNVGRGVAREVEARWSFDAHDFAAVLAPYEESIGGQIWIEGNTVQLEAKDAPAWFTTGSHIQRLGAILPLPNGQENTIALDFAYSRLVCAFFGAASLGENQDMLNNWMLPDVRLHLSYKDMEGNRYTKLLRLRFQLVVLVPSGWPDDGKHDEIAQGYFQVDDA